MALEDLVGPDKFLDALVRSNPEATDVVEEGDDHIRGLKNVTLNSLSAMTDLLTFVDDSVLKLPGINARLAVGVASPATTLHVRGANQEVIRIETDGTGNGGNVTYNGVSPNLTRGFIGWGDNMFSGAALDEFGLKSNGPLAFATNGDNTQRLYIDAAGNVGIGTTTPQRTLDVREIIGVSPDDARLTAELKAEISTAAGALDLYTGEGTPVLRTHIAALGDSYINTGNNFGIGTNNPTELLTLAGGTSARIQVQNSTFAERAAFGLATDAGFLSLSDVSGGANTLLRSDTGVSYINVSNFQNLGLGTTTPTVNGFGMEISGATQAGLRVTENSSGRSGEFGTDTVGSYLSTLTSGSTIRFFSGTSVLAMTIESNQNVAAVNRFSADRIASLGGVIDFDNFGGSNFQQLVGGVYQLVVSGLTNIQCDGPADVRMTLSQGTALFENTEGGASSMVVAIENDFKRYLLRTTVSTNDFDIVDNNAGTVRSRISSAGLHFLFLPTSDPGTSGALWNNGGVVNVSP